jgi:hypothetical protein
VLIVNKAVVKDQGSSWVGVVLVGYLLGLVLVHLLKWLRRRRPVS